MTKRRTPRAEEIVNLAVAQDCAVELQSYLSRGRRLGQLSDQALSLKYVEAMREWVASLASPPAHLSIQDVTAEYDLRGLKAEGTDS